jgi:hypothetical protein
MRNPVTLSLILIALCSSAQAQSWRVKDAAGLVHVYDLGTTQILQVYDLQGNLITTHPIIAPYLQSQGSLIFQKPDNSNLYASRVLGTVQWQLGTTSPPAATVPGFLNLDGKWYSLVNGFVQAFYAPNDHSIDSSAANCTAGGMPLPTAIAPKLNLSGVLIGLAPTEDILIEHLPNADVIRMRSRSGNIVCNGQVTSPEAPIEFKNGFEDPTA